MKKTILNEGTIEYEIEKVKKTSVKPSLLLHACCGPCASSVLEYLYPFFNITVYFYNPNIMPKEEFNKRLDALKIVISHYNGVKLIVPNQEENEYLNYIHGLEKEPEGGSRCSRCFALRLDNTAKYLSNNKDTFDFFTTTLTVSPHKNAELINKIGNEIANKYNVVYLDSNFKKKDGYLRSTQLSKEWDIYRQNYCGCCFTDN